MATATQQQARSHHARQAGTAAAAALAVRSLFSRNRPWSEILTTIAAYQLAAATAASQTMAASAGSQPLVNPAAFAGVSSLGFPLSEPIVATIDARVQAPVEPLPSPWWDDASVFLREIEQLIASEVQDAGRSAYEAELVAAPDWQNYVRVLVPPSCKKCAILAGRIYRDLEAFDRHPGCDCQMWRVQDWDQAEAEGLVTSFEELFRRGQIRDLSEADAQAIRDGADPAQVVNATRGGGTRPLGITDAFTTEVFGRKVKATHYGATKRSAWRKKNPSRLVRLRPESIYQIVDREYGGDHDQAIRLLGVYGYVTT